jgi:hypothetical protein
LSHVFVLFFFFCFLFFFFLSVNDDCSVVVDANHVFVLQVADWSGFVEPHLNNIQGHSAPRQFKFEHVAANNRVEMFVKMSMLPEEQWCGIAANGGGPGWVAFKQADPLPPVDEWRAVFPDNFRSKINVDTNDIYKYPRHLSFWFVLFDLLTHLKNICAGDNLTLYPKEAHSTSI